MIDIIVSFLNFMIHSLGVDLFIYPTVALLVLAVTLTTIQIIKGRG